MFVRVFVDCICRHCLISSIQHIPADDIMALVTFTSHRNRKQESVWMHAHHQAYSSLLHFKKRKNICMHAMQVRDDGLVWLPLGLPQCRYGRHCYRTKANHKYEFSHPVERSALANNNNHHHNNNAANRDYGNPHMAFSNHARPNAHAATPNSYRPHENSVNPIPARHIKVESDDETNVHDRSDGQWMYPGQQASVHGQASANTAGSSANGNNNSTAIAPRFQTDNSRRDERSDGHRSAWSNQSSSSSHLHESTSANRQAYTTSAGSSAFRLSLSSSRPDTRGPPASGCPQPSSSTSTTGGSGSTRKQSLSSEPARDRCTDSATAGKQARTPGQQESESESAHRRCTGSAGAYGAFAGKEARMPGQQGSAGSMEQNWWEDSSSSDSDSEPDTRKQQQTTSNARSDKASTTKQGSSTSMAQAGRIGGKGLLSMQSGSLSSEVLRHVNQSSSHAHVSSKPHSGLAQNKKPQAAQRVVTTANTASTSAQRVQAQTKTSVRDGGITQVKTGAKRLKTSHDSSATKVCAPRTPVDDDMDENVIESAAAKASQGENTYTHVYRHIHA